MQNISFGALAKAQASIGRGRHEEENRKKKTPKKSLKENPEIITKILAQKLRHDDAAQKKQKRSSKHAPTIQTAKKPVSRKRSVIETVQKKPRDPRFDPTTMTNNNKNPKANANNAYSFLNEYRQDELNDLKTRLSKTKSDSEKEHLKKAIRSTSDRMRAVESRRQEDQVRAEHKAREKQLIREGKKKPDYLKKSSLKEQVLKRKYEGMKSRDRVRALERRRKKLAARERRDMPMDRRVAG